MSDGLVERTPLQEAWAELLKAIPEHWNVGPASWHLEERRWWMYAWDTRSRRGKRSREWSTVAPTEVEVVRGMARCLREIGEGRVPK